MKTQELPATLESALQKLRQVSEKYSSKSALGEPSPATWWTGCGCFPFSLIFIGMVCCSAADYPHVSQQVKQLEEDSCVALTEVAAAQSVLGRVLSAWDSYGDCLSSLQAWLQHTSSRLSHGHGADVLANTHHL